MGHKPPPYTPCRASRVRKHISHPKGISQILLRIYIALTRKIALEITKGIFALSIYLLGFLYIILVMRKPAAFVMI